MITKMIYKDLNNNSSYLIDKILETQIILQVHTMILLEFYAFSKNDQKSYKKIEFLQNSLKEKKELNISIYSLIHYINACETVWDLHLKNKDSTFEVKIIEGSLITIKSKKSSIPVIWLDDHNVKKESDI